MKPIELASQLRKSKPRLLADITDEFAARVISAAFAEVRNQIELVEEGPIRIAGLGRFVVRRFKPDNAADGELKRRVIFKAADPGGGPNDQRALSPPVTSPPSRDDS